MESSQAILVVKRSSARRTSTFGAGIVAVMALPFVEIGRLRDGPGGASGR
ncbi:hypothetical protein GCM10009530_44770 [Microbispora corallina]|uniref:Uncharacterized protein n=1 Tax=Microbispora corallina TaxID=83302 RepID=A0ABQ4FWS8_9ACTN|nr:hypothetical protein Mco01_22640 [Microbispora corallina]